MNAFPNTQDTIPLKFSSLPEYPRHQVFSPSRLPQTPYILTRTVCALVFQRISELPSLWRDWLDRNVYDPMWFKRCANSSSNLYLSSSELDNSATSSHSGPRPFILQITEFLKWYFRRPRRVAIRVCNLEESYVGHPHSKYSRGQNKWSYNHSKWASVISRLYKILEVWMKYIRIYWYFICTKCLTKGCWQENSILDWVLSSSFQCLKHHLEPVSLIRRYSTVMD